MTIQSLILRQEQPDDYRTVETITREAFWNLFEPGCMEHTLVHVLRTSPVFIPELDFVAVANGQIIGNIMYTQAFIQLDAGGKLPVIIIGPLTVHPSYQRMGVGRALIRHTAELAKAQGYTAIFLFGDPAYYSRNGFVPGETFGIASKQNTYHAALQTLVLQPGALDNASGLLIDDDVYTIDPEENRLFDQTFPAKALVEGTPSQQRFQKIIAMQKPRA